MRLPLALVLALALLGSAAPAAANPMDLALARLSRQDAGDPRCPAGGGTRCADELAYRSLVAQLGLAIVPPMLLPAATLGSRHFALDVDLGLVAIDHEAAYWARGTAGRGGTENARVTRQLRSLRLGARKGLPGGLELGASVATLTGTSYFVVGAELRLGLLEGFRRGPLGKLPDVALRVALNALVGEADLNLFTPALDLTFSKGILLGGELVLSPLAGVQLAWTFSESEVVDLTPDVDAFALCDPDPAGAATGELRCRGSGADLANDVQFPGTRSFRVRVAFGAELRWRQVAARASLSLDARDPAADGDVPPGTGRQWSLLTGLSLRY